MLSRITHASLVASFSGSNEEGRRKWIKVPQSSPGEGEARIKVFAATEEPIASKEPAASPPTKARVAWSVSWICIVELMWMHSPCRGCTGEIRWVRCAISKWFLWRPGEQGVLRCVDEETPISLDISDPLSHDWGVEAIQSWRANCSSAPIRTAHQTLQHGQPWFLLPSLHLPFGESLTHTPHFTDQWGGYFVDTS